MRGLVLILVILVIFSTACAHQSNALVFVSIPAEDAVSTVENWQPLMDYLASQLGCPVEFRAVTDYAAVAEALKYGHADIARLGPSSYILTEGEVDLISVVSIANDDGSLMSYQSYIIARPGITTLDGATFAYVDAGSTSGYLLPATYIKKHNIQLGEVLYAGSHPAVIEAVKNGTVDAGATNDIRWLSAVFEGVIRTDELVILWQSDPIPRGPTVVRSDMPADLRLALQTALINAPPEIVAQCNLGSDHFGPAPPDVYDPIREIQQYIGL